jgi:hypothetical protein
LDQQTKHLWGNYSFKSFDLEKITASYIPDLERGDRPHGLLDIEGNVSGSTLDPDIAVKANIRQAMWRGQPFRSELELKMNKSTATILPSIFSFDHNGALTLQGQYLSSQSKFDLEGKGANIRLNTLFGFLGWSLQLDGQSDLDFTFSDHNQEKNMEISLAGRHDGIGPFKQPGKIEGKITGDLREIDLTGLRITSGEGYAKLLAGSKLFIEKNGSGTFRLPLETRNLGAGLLVFFGNADIAGSWGEKTTNPEGRLTNLDIFARSLWVNQYYFDGNVTRITIKKAQIKG